MSIKEKEMKKMNNEINSIKRPLSIVEKIFIIFLGFFSFPLGLSLSYIVVKEINPFSVTHLPLLSIGWVVIFLLLIFSEFYFKNVSLFKGLFKATVSSIILSFVIYFSVFSLYVIIGTFPVSYIIYASLGAGVYITLLTLVRILLVILNRVNKKIALIIGPKEDALTLAKKLLKENFKKIKVKYIFFENNGKVSEEIFEKFKECNSIIILDTLTFENKQKFLLYFNSNLNKDVFYCTTYFDIVLVGHEVTSINDILSFEQKPLRIDLVEASVKRIIDIIASLIILILATPIWLFVPLIIKLQDGGPVFYKQVRLTKDMKEFKIIKFRSMRVDAEKVGGAQLAKSNDSRITKFGKLIRATRIDEIPQILNVLKGDMSLVGPRPERPEFVKDFLKENPLYKYRFNVKAGVTGYQQVSTTYHTTYDDKLRYDLYYIANYDTIFDLYILFLTVKTVLSKAMAEGVSEDFDLPFNEFMRRLELEYKEDNEHIHINLKRGKKQC